MNKSEIPSGLGGPVPNGFMYKIPEVEAERVLAPMRVQIAFRAIEMLERFRQPSVVPGTEGGHLELSLRPFTPKEAATYDACLTTIQTYITGEDDCGPCGADHVMMLSPKVLEQLNEKGFASIGEVPVLEE